MPPLSETEPNDRPRGGVSRARSGSFTIVFSIVAALLILLILGPVAKLLLFSPWTSWGDAVRDPELHGAIGLTVATASLATALAVGLGVPLGYLLARHRFRGRSLLEGLLQIPVLIPHPVAGIALLVFLGRDTAVGGTLAAFGLEIVNHIPGLVAAMAFVSAPIFISAASEAFRSVEPRLARVARSLGDSEWRAFRRITLPLARRSLAAAAVVTWARAVSEFGAVVVVTYHPKVASVLIFDRLTTDGLRGAVPAAALLVLVALLVVGVLSWLNARGAGMISVEGLAIRRGAFQMVDVGLVVPTGGYGVVIGPTGAGKTTLLDLIAGHVAPDRGSIRIAGRDATRLPPEARGVGIVYQRHHLFPHLDVRANVGYGLVHRRDRAEPASQRVADVARALGIEHLLDRSVDGLSGGERQRVALARALAPRPHVLLLDEPLASLDPRTRRHLRDELRLAHAAEGSTVLHVTHDFEDALALGDQVALMHEGRLLQSGTPVDVFRKPATPFVAEFIGSGNVLAGVVEESDANRAVFRSGPVALQVVSDRRGGCHALIQPEEILVSRTALPSPPRNHLTGRIVRIEITGPLARIHLDVGVGIAALLTRVSVEEMALRPDDVVHVAIKATAIHIM